MRGKPKDRRSTRGFRLPDLRRLQRESPTPPFVFVASSPFTAGRFALMVQRAADGAGLELKAHPHMLRHACGYVLTNKGQDTREIRGWLGHRSITSTAVYTALAPNRFKDFRRPEPFHSGHRRHPFNGSATAGNEATTLRIRRPRAARRAGK
jgi:integrase